MLLNLAVCVVYFILASTLASLEFLSQHPECLRWMCENHCKNLLAISLNYKGKGELLKLTLGYILLVPTSMTFIGELMQAVIQINVTGRSDMSLNQDWKKVSIEFFPNQVIFSFKHFKIL